MKGRKRQPTKLRETAQLNTMVKQNKTWAEKRLLRDYKEIQENSVPTVGVTACPTDDNYFVWRGNLRGPEGTPYQGGVFHIEIVFPQLYPTEPPKIHLMTPLTHPNVFGKEICLDMLDGNDRVLYQGWTSGYTVQSVLIQLQSFLFEKPPKHSEEKIKREVKLANEFKDLSINHKGPLSPYPPFSTKEKDEDSFVMAITEKELLEEELVCFHTRLSLINDTTVLGAGISFSRLPRTGEIKDVSTTVDLLSNQAYMKCGVRHSLSNEKFTHFLPLYFGIQMDKTIFLVEHAISFICKGSTKKFASSQVLEVLTKMFKTLIVDMTNESLHHSYKSIRMLIYIHRLMMIFIEKYPEISETIDQCLAKFIDHPECRIKDETPDIGELLVYLTISKKYFWEDLKEAYLGEQLDRQILWIIREIPNLEKIKDSELEDAKLEASFKSTIVGFRITMLFKLFNTEIIEKTGKDFQKFAEFLDQRYCRLEESTEKDFKDAINTIFEVRSYVGYYSFVGKNVHDKKALASALDQAMKNSLEKKYHGDESDKNVIPKISEQATSFHRTLPNLMKYWDEKLQKLDKEGDEDFWKTLCLEKYEFISNKMRGSFGESTPKQLAEQMDMCRIYGISEDDDPLIKLNQQTFGNYNLKDIHGQKGFHEYKETMTWMELFIKLDFEGFLEVFPMMDNFKLLYDYLHAVNGKLSCLYLKIHSKIALKSGYYWYMVILSNLTSLEGLIIHDEELLLRPAFKYISKGFANFFKNGGKLKKLFLSQVNENTIQAGLYNILKNLPQLESICTYQCTLRHESGKAIGKILSDFKYMKELDFSGNSCDDTFVKEIADGLMRAKMLETLKLQRLYNCTEGIASILYSLAFSPRIRHIDLSHVPIGSDSRLCEALYKVLKISGSIEHLILNHTEAHEGLSKDFFICLGENKTLKSLHLDSKNKFKTTFAKYLGTAVAMNSKKDCSLETLSCSNGFSNNGLETFINSLYISEKDHERWYGDAVVAEKMSGSDLDLRWNFNIKHFNINQTILRCDISIATLKKYTNPKYPPLVRLFSSCMTHVDLNNSGLNSKRTMELLTTCLDNPLSKCKVTHLNLSKNGIDKEGSKIFCEALKKQFTIRSLDLSGNKLGVSGCKSIAHALKTNTSVVSLNLYSNQIDVDGARYLKETLLVNDTLEYIDVGSNRIRDKGLLEMAEGIIGNSTCALKSISMRYNFITDDGAEKFFDKILSSSKIERVFLKNNYLTDPFIVNLQKRLDDFEYKIFVDAFDKVKYLAQDKLVKSIWISPINALFTEQSITKFFQEDQECGLVKEVRMFKGSEKEGKQQENIYAFVEFEHENSVARSLRVASKKKSFLHGTRFKIFKAGTQQHSSTAPKAAKIPEKRNTGRGGAIFRAMQRGLTRGRGPIRGPARGRDFARPQRFTRGGFTAFSRGLNQRKRRRESSSSSETPTNNQATQRKRPKRL
ncbi:unnamed protein product [Moneuplotes crassus]|uniref:Uncharacterized protein n=1 Tax=Euplotes crassus TaxID=5936 RepID=A0AAD1U844_EUPCR|nr:unnamed protein product [Moneuplotes crassus]